jgi:hypothetical protein
MSALELLQELPGLGVQLTADGDRLRVRARRGAVPEGLLARLAQHKAELLALVRRRLTEPDGWDQARADRTLAEALGLIDQAVRHRTRRPARRNVLAVYRELAVHYHARADPLLWEVPEALARLLGRWSEEDAGSG